MIVPSQDIGEMDHGVGDEEPRARDRRRPIGRPPRPHRERNSGDQERRADVLHEVSIIGAGLGHSWHAGVPG